MKLKKLFQLFLITSATFINAQETTKVKAYGFVSNEFFYNSRQNEEVFDGILHLFPKPIDMAAGVDKNQVSQSEMLSINSRIGIDISGAPILGAKSTAKIEADFAGTGSTYFLLRLRQAYMKLNWNRTELLIGQTWHPLFGNVAPITLSANSGAPFNSFNRSPQVRLKETLGKSLTLTAAALYEMQFVSQGPIAKSSSYLKNAIAPELFIGLENKTKHWTLGFGGDFKTLKPEPLNDATISSLSANAYAQYVNGKLQVKAKTTYGENLSNQLMIGGYGVSKYAADSTTVISYTNINNLSSWINIVYGTKLQVGLLLGASENIGTRDNLDFKKGKMLTVYGFGTDNSKQQILDAVYRIAPQVSYNLSNFKFGIEYDYTTASYGRIMPDGVPVNFSNVNNHRILATVMYIF